jgi:hypothetical protein
MSEAGGTGQAGPAEAVTANGAGEPPHVQLAYAQAEVAMADERVERMRAKLAKAKASAKAAESDAAEGLAQAQAEAAEARERVAELERKAG